MGRSSLVLGDQPGQSGLEPACGLERGLEPLRVSTTRITVGMPVTFDASSTVDPNGSGVLPQSGAWTFGDGGSANGL
ncbi:MAG TPA: hypothetical protein VMS76_06685, partial [Planctomycetota bacterium]|nr:hypothetical protein [Planctomycetota bacterium]